MVSDNTKKNLRKHTQTHTQYAIENVKKNDTKSFNITLHYTMCKVHTLLHNAIFISTHQ